MKLEELKSWESASDDETVSLTASSKAVKNFDNYEPSFIRRVKAGDGSYKTVETKVEEYEIIKKAPEKSKTATMYVLEEPRFTKKETTTTARQWDESITTSSSYEDAGEEEIKEKKTINPSEIASCLALQYEINKEREEEEREQEEEEEGEEELEEETEEEWHMRMQERQKRFGELEGQEKEEQEEWAQNQLQLAGCCPAGFTWARVEGGYRCYGRGHVITDELLSEGTGQFFIHPSTGPTNLSILLGPFLLTAEDQKRITEERLFRERNPGVSRPFMPGLDIMTNLRR